MLERYGMQQDQPDEGRITTASTGAAVGACPGIEAHWPPTSDAERYANQHSHVRNLNTEYEEHG